MIQAGRVALGVAGIGGLTQRERLLQFETPAIFILNNFYDILLFTTLLKAFRERVTGSTSFALHRFDFPHLMKTGSGLKLHFKRRDYYELVHAVVYPYTLSEVCNESVSDDAGTVVTSSRFP